MEINMSYIIASTALIADNPTTLDSRRLVRLELDNSTTIILDGYNARAYQSLRSGLTAWRKLCNAYEQAGWALAVSE